MEYLFDDSISSLEQAEDGARVTFRSGSQRAFGLVVGAEGLHSNVRGLSFGAEAQFHRYLGYYFAGFSVDADFGRDSEVVMHNRPSRMAALYAVRNQRRLNVLLTFGVKERLDRRLSLDEQFELVGRACAGDGWEVPRLLAAMRTADDLFFNSVSQVRMSRWPKGRVALIGGGGYAPSFLSGQGNSMAVVGAYQLAAALAAAGGDHGVAFPGVRAVYPPFRRAEPAAGSEGFRHFDPMNSRGPVAARSDARARAAAAPAAPLAEPPAFSGPRTR